MDSTNRAKSAPVQERLKSLDQEIQKLYLACKDAGCTHDKIRETARPLLQAARRGQWKGYIRRGAIWSVVVGVLIASQWLEPIYNPTSALAKKMLVKVMPYFDWTKLYEACLIKNPYYKGPNGSLVASDCQVCQNLPKLQIMTKVNTSYMVELLFRKEPTVIVDAMNDWKAMEEPITIDNIMEIYQSSPDLADKDKLCNLFVTAGLNLRNATVQDLFEKLENERAEGRNHNFTAFWNTCHRDSAKEMHKLYYTPYFLPGMCESQRNKNYIYIGRKSANGAAGLSFLGKHFRKGFGHWFAQLHGSMQIMLLPASVCKNICSKIKITLERGQILNIPNFHLFDFAFRPHTEEAVAIGATYHFE